MVYVFQQLQNIPVIVLLRIEVELNVKIQVKFGKNQVKMPKKKVKVVLQKSKVTQK